MSAHHNHEAHQKDGRAFLIAITLNACYVVFQATYAYMAHSASLLADAGHNLGDVLGLLMAWLASYLLTKSPTRRLTFGYKKVSLLAALGNSLIMIFTCGVIATESIHRLLEPDHIAALEVVAVASVGIMINGGSALLFMGKRHDLNVKAAFLHLAYDALISLGVVLGAILIYFTGWEWIDPVLGLLIGSVILKGTWKLFGDSINLILGGVPRDISLVEVENLLKSIPGVSEVHYLHIFALSTRENALSVHLIMPEKPLTESRRRALLETLRDEHHIQHVTIQVERQAGECYPCCPAQEKPGNHS